MQSELEKWQKELRKGSTKMALLSLIGCRDMYGYEITRELSRITDNVFALTESNAYPALHLMENEQLITSYWKETEAGMPPRKYYRITPRGRAFFGEMKKEWMKHNEAMDRICQYEG
ncbi:MAG: lineage-specific thermal regulator protein [Methanocella sp. PtaU1.Bin125]|nr:MAG: lineage-specific thermal regulator protein [Methanocella sp. PtaU1.Bin125]